jgi:hypothetical protein
LYSSFYVDDPFGTESPISLTFYFIIYPYYTTDGVRILLYQEVYYFLKIGILPSVFQLLRLLLPLPYYDTTDGVRILLIL